MRPLLLSLLCACGPPSVEGSRCGRGSDLVAATTDFTAGVLAAVDPAERTLDDRIATTGGDPLVRASGGFVWQINRSNGDTLRRHGGDLCVPDWEVALQPGANAHDVLVLGDEVWVAQYGSAELEVRAVADGTLRAAVDLSELADADGLPELHQLVWLGDRLLVVAQRFDRTVAGWLSTDGLLAELDPDGRTVVERWEVGPSPRLVAHPGEPGKGLLLTGTYGQADGGLEIFDPDDGSLASVVDEATLGRDLEQLVASGDRVVLLASDFDLDEGGGSAAVCVDLLTGDVVEGTVGPEWFVDAAWVGDEVWVAARRGWGEGSEPGLFPVDPATCATSGARLVPALEPYSLAVRDDG